MYQKVTHPMFKHSYNMTQIIFIYLFLVFLFVLQKRTIIIVWNLTFLYYFVRRQRLEKFNLNKIKMKERKNVKILHSNFIKDNLNDEHINL